MRFMYSRGTTAVLLIVTINFNSSMQLDAYEQMLFKRNMKIDVSVSPNFRNCLVCEGDDCRECKCGKYRLLEHLLSLFCSVYFFFF